jgi:predicted RNase H-like HicB family nuclease
MKLTIVVSKGSELYVSSIKEIPAVVSQGATIEEAKENIIDALQLYLEDMQQETTLENVVLEEDLMIA